MTSERRRNPRPEQIVAKLRDADAMLNAGEDLAAVCRLWRSARRRSLIAKEKRRVSPTAFLPVEPGPFYPVHPSHARR